MIKYTNLFITATNTDVGKTFASELFLNHYTKKGLKVGYFKPIETGVKDLPLDGNKMLEVAKRLNPKFKVSLSNVVPYQFELPAAPYIAKGNTIIDIDFIVEKKNYLQTLCDILIIEGAGGLMVPIEKDFFMIDLIKKLDTKTILIAPSKLGGINDTLLSMEALKNRKIDFDWYINLFIDKEDFYKVSMPFYKNYFTDIKFLDELN